MVSVRNQILEYIRKRGRGLFVFPSDLRGVGNTDAVKEALSTLTKDKILVRLGHGIYYFPKIDPDLGIMYPGLHDVADAVAKKDGVLITPTADYAMNLLGLSEQVPLNVVYLTSGRSKVIKVGKNKITFKQASSRRSQAGKNYMGLIVRALEGIGADNLTPESLEDIHAKMSDLSDMEILTGAKKAPQWIANIFTEFVKKRYDKMANTDREEKKGDNQ